MERLTRYDEREAMHSAFSNYRRFTIFGILAMMCAHPASPAMENASQIIDRSRWRVEDELNDVLKHNPRRDRLLYETEVTALLRREIAKLDGHLAGWFDSRFSRILGEIHHWRVNTDQVIELLLPVISFRNHYPDGFSGNFNPFPVASALIHAGVMPGVLLKDITEDDSINARFKLLVLSQTMGNEDAAALLEAHFTRHGDMAPEAMDSLRAAARLIADTGREFLLDFSDLTYMDPLVRKYTPLTIWSEQEK